MGKVATLSLLHLHFSCGVAVDVDIPPIWDSVARGIGKMEGLSTLNQALMMGPAILLPDLQREGAYQRLPPPARLCKKYEPYEPLSRPRVHREGVHGLADTLRIS